MTTPDDPLAGELRGFGPLGVAAILVITAANVLLAPLGAVLVLVWVQWSRTPWREIGYVRPKSWIGSAAIGIVFGVVFKLVMKSLVMPLLGADPVNHAYNYLQGNTAALPGFVLLIVADAGFGEETLFRGFFFERLGKLLGAGTRAKVLIVVLTTTLFAGLHYFEQGVAGVEQAVFTGLAFGSIFAVTGELWMLMCAHVAFDLMAGALIYWGLETKVAHLVFK